MRERRPAGVSVVVKLLLPAALLMPLAGFVAADARTAALPARQPATASSVRPSGVLKVDYDAVTGRLGVEACDADLAEIIGAVARKSAVTIELGAGIGNKMVSVSFGGLSLEEGINAVVVAAGEGNLVAEYTKQPGGEADSFRLERVVLLRKGQPAGGAGMVVGGGAAVREDRAALGEMMRKYEDPKTAREEKRELRRSIRRGARTPEEKAQLKRAVLDPRNGGQLEEDLQLALALSMREHPEGSDKAYVLELLRRESSPGYLVRTMVGSGDPTYVNYLLSAAQAKDVHAIELIGDLRVVTAVPVLQQLVAAPGTGSAARQAAATALRRLGVADADIGGSPDHVERLNR